jgi:hypothetical protein
MAAPTSPQNRISGWKIIALRSVFVGVGFALTLALIAGVLAWYHSRPKPAQSWNSAAIVSSDPPGFSASKDGTRIEFHYTLENTTDADYEIDSDIYFKLLLKNNKGTLSRPLTKEQAYLALPVFVPAKQKALARLSIALSNIPIQGPDESDDSHHERLRAHLEEQLKNLANFVVFDDVRHYRIDLPRWQPSKESVPSSP